MREKKPPHSVNPKMLRFIEVKSPTSRKMSTIKSGSIEQVKRRSKSGLANTITLRILSANTSTGVCKCQPPLRLYIKTIIIKLSPSVAIMEFHIQ